MGRGSSRKRGMSDESGEWGGGRRESGERVRMSEESGEWGEKLLGRGNGVWPI